jgi:hypothetical protein
MSSAIHCLICGVLFAFGSEQDRVQRFLNHSCTGSVHLDNAERRHPVNYRTPITDGAA